MNRKRYQKKVYALVTRYAHEYPDFAKQFNLFKQVRRLKIVNGVWENGHAPAPASYSEAWEILEPNRRMLGMQ